MLSLVGQTEVTCKLVLIEKLKPWTLFGAFLINPDNQKSSTSL